MEGSDIDMEGCLSFPEIYLSISRPTRVVIEGFGPNGKKIVREAKGLLARCFLHEIDHLNGTLIIDHISPEERIPWEEEIAKLLQQKRR
jgi:peptide deformylase